MVLGTAAVTAVVCGLGYALGCEDTPAASEAPTADVAAKTKYTRAKATEKPSDQQREDIAGDNLTEDESEQEESKDGGETTTKEEGEEETAVAKVLSDLVAAVEEEEIASQVRLVLGRVVDHVVAERATIARTLETETEDAVGVGESIEAGADGSNQSENSGDAVATTKDEDRPEEEDPSMLEGEGDSNVKRFRSLPLDAGVYNHLTAARSSNNNDEDL
ncbi:hypothetical protein PINS_up010152 [Pythium insidiosum]|nr:hypothetical protein PINS_up010152 [Pythium insidiosum]